MDRDSPQSAGKNRKPAVQGDELPAIRSCSDIAWLLWKEFGQDVGNIKNLNYFLSLSITNAETQAIISSAIRSAIPDAESFPAWGGYEFDTDTPEGQAILGQLRCVDLRIGRTDQRPSQAHPILRHSAISFCSTKQPLAIYTSPKLVFFTMTERGRGRTCSSLWSRCQQMLTCIIRTISRLWIYQAFLGISLAGIMLLVQSTPLLWALQTFRLLCRS